MVIQQQHQLEKALLSIKQEHQLLEMSIGWKDYKEAREHLEAIQVASVLADRILKEEDGS